MTEGMFTDTGDIANMRGCCMTIGDSIVCWGCCITGIANSYKFHCSSSDCSTCGSCTRTVIVASMHRYAAFNETKTCKHLWK